VRVSTVEWCCFVASSKNTSMAAVAAGQSWVAARIEHVPNVVNLVDFWGPHIGIASSILVRPYRLCFSSQQAS
jgi:hypothetical protein